MKRYRFDVGLVGTGFRFERPGDGNFHAGYESQVQSPRRRAGLGKTVRGIVIRERHGVATGGCRELDQRARRQQAVRGDAVIVQIKILQFIPDVFTCG